MFEKVPDHQAQQQCVISFDDDKENSHINAKDESIGFENHRDDELDFVPNKYK